MAQNSNGNERFNGWRTQPMYTFAEAARLAHVSASTVRNWLFGYADRGQPIKPLFKPPADQGPMVSFLQLIEIVIAGKFRKTERVSFQRIRRAYENAREQFGLEFPFAHLKLEALGGHIVRRLHDEEPGASLQTLDEPEQWTLPGLVLDTIHQIEYEEDLAARWYPISKSVPIVVDPRFSAGIPTIKGRGVTIEAIHKRFKADHKISFIAKVLALEADVVETAIRYAEQLAA